MQINRFGAVGSHGWLYYLEVDIRIQMSPEERMKILTGLLPLKDQFKSFKHFTRKILVNNVIIVSEIVHGQSDYSYNIRHGE